MVSQYSGCLTINKTHLVFFLSIFFASMTNVVLSSLVFFIGTVNQCNTKKIPKISSVLLFKWALLVFHLVIDE